MISFVAEVRTGQVPLAEVGVSSGRSIRSVVSSGRSIRSVPVIVPKSSANIIATGTARCVRAPRRGPGELGLGPCGRPAPFDLRAGSSSWGLRCHWLKPTSARDTLKFVG